MLSSTEAGLRASFARQIGAPSSSDRSAVSCPDARECLVPMSPAMLAVRPVADGLMLSRQCRGRPQAAAPVDQDVAVCIALVPLGQPSRGFERRRPTDFGRLPARQQRRHKLPRREASASVAQAGLRASRPLVGQETRRNELVPD